MRTCGLILGLILAAGVTAVFGSGSQPLPEPKAKSTTSAVDPISIYNQGVALVHEKKYSPTLANCQTDMKANPNFGPAPN